MPTPDTGAAAWALVFFALASGLVRLILGVLAAYAARKALSASDTSQAADRLRAHRLAVLRELLNGSRHLRR